MNWQFKEFCTRITEINSTINAIKIRETEEVGLKGSHVMLLYELNRRNEGMTGAELSDVLCLDKAAISRAVAQLEEKGFVRTDLPKTGKRYRALIRLTKEGTKMADTLEDKIDRAVGAGTVSELTDDERKKFYGVLSEISQNLKTYLDNL